MSGTKSPEYQKLQEMFDIVTRHLGDILSAEELAAKLYVKKLITRSKVDVFVQNPMEEVDYSTGVRTPAVSPYISM